MGLDMGLMAPPPAAGGPQLAARGPLLRAAGVFLVGLLLTAAGSLMLYDAARQRERRTLEDEAGARVRHVELSIELALESLQALRALFEASLPVTADGFDRFARAEAARHRGTLALGWAPRVDAGARAGFERELAALQGRPSAFIFESTGHGMRRPAQPRPEHFPLLHLAAIEGGEIEPGQDLLALSGRRQAIEIAVHSGRPAATKVRRADAWGAPGELVIQVFLPVRDPAAGPLAPPRGVVIGVFSVSEILGRVFDPVAERLRVAIFDRSAPAAEQALYTLGLDEGLRHEAELRAQPGADDGVLRPFQFADRRWVAHLLPLPGRSPLSTLLWPMAGLGAGLLLTSLLAAYLFVAMVRGRQLFWLHRQLDGVQQRLIDEQVAAEVQRRLREQALAAARARSSFLQAASHDLRQPLHALSLYLNLLGDAPERGRDPVFMAQLQHSAAALQGLFDALLDIGRLESGQIEPAPRPFALRPLLLGLIEESRGLAQRKGLRLLDRLEAVGTVSDPLLIERIVRNLLVNALRYTPQGWVALRCRVRGGRLRLQVFDSGPGLAPAQRRRLLDEAAGAPAAREGAGLGLSIVQELARKLGHPLSLRSRPGRGSVLTLELPLADPAAEGGPQAGPAPAAAPWTAGHVLLVDDDPEVRSATAARLRAWGATVAEAGSLAEARLALADPERPPGLVLLDLQLSDGRGSELLPALRDAAGRPLPTVWLSADPAAAELPGAIVLRKPASALKLRSALDAAQRAARP
ncbi:CHASE domain-containing protein [Aquariibacter albus]|nr:CHASE domain-containing protein [Aquariibacter albus]